MASDKHGKSDNAQVVATQLNQAQDAFNSGDFEAAKALADLVLQSASLARNPYVGARLVHLQILARRGSFAGLVGELEELLSSDPRIGSIVQAKVGNEIIRVSHRSGNLEMGAQRGEELIRDFGERWPVTEVVELLCQTASCHFFRGDTERAEEIVARALEMAEKSKSPKSIAQSYWQLSLLSASRGNIWTSLSQNEEAQRWARLAEMNRILPILRNNAASIRLELPNQDLAYIHELAETAYLELTALNDPGAATYACLSLSEVELRQSNYERAHLYVDKGLSELPREIPDPRASLHIQKAKILARSGNYAQSETQAELAVSLMRSTEPSKFLATLWALVARVFVEIGFPERGVFAYEQSLQIAGVIREEADTHAKSV